MDGIDKTNSQLQKTNDLTAQMKQILDETEGRIHLQVLTIAFQQLTQSRKHPGARSATANDALRANLRQ